jgi:hypothetical protein
MLAVRTTELRTMARRGQIPSIVLPSGARRYHVGRLRAWVRDLKRQAEQTGDQASRNPGSDDPSPSVAVPVPA